MYTFNVCIELESNRSTAYVLVILIFILYLPATIP